MVDAGMRLRWLSFSVANKRLIKEELYKDIVFRLAIYNERIMSLTPLHLNLIYEFYYFGDLYCVWMRLLYPSQIRSSTNRNASASSHETPVVAVPENIMLQFGKNGSIQYRSKSIYYLKP